MSENRKYKIKVKKFTGIRLAVQGAVNRALIFLNLKDAENFWGIVYDSVSKQPLDPVIVKLVYADGKEVDSCITDLSGRYGFLARRGKFKILARKTNYVFPSKFVEEKRDGIYENLYHGEFFVLNKDEEVVAPNIPMDPEYFDWNQKAKQKILLTNPKKEWLKRRFLSACLGMVLIICLLGLPLLNPTNKFGDYFILAIYALAILLAITVKEPRLWGKIFFRSQNRDWENLFMELHSAQFPAVGFGKVKVNSNGKFLLRANKGEYMLSVLGVDKNQHQTIFGSVRVKIGSNGVFNGSIVLED